MSVLKIVGGRRLSGSVRVQGAKNSALPMLAASVMTEGISVLRNCPALSDVETTLEILRHVGCRVYRDGDAVYVDASGPISPEVPDELMRRMRSSVIFLGALLARCGEAALSLPGGCELGPRPVDLHLLALRALGAEITEAAGRLCCRAGRLRGGHIDLPAVSVGATENAMLAACLAEGTTVITGAAREPEIQDLQAFLRAAGALVSGAGSGVIRIRGVEKLRGAEHRIIPDRIAAATWLAACASAGGSVRLYDADPGRCGPILQVLRRMGCSVSTGEGLITLERRGGLVSPRSVVTRPYPGFPTDAQPPLMAAALRARGTTVMIETIFEARYRHVPALRRMGADVRTEGKTAVIRGVERLRGTETAAADLRGGAALAVAALAAEGETVLGGLQHVDRGYEDLAGTLAALGAEVIRI
ncbi:MAG: UDP-N-acetylglucosamine 1-carboxyvinyltransferase [Oscillospiraceae bacterium]|nr:UDP-N-acetylglucosamine 1-carboxyvinyltransferase [Oscillospiraceae bacterium]